MKKSVNYNDVFEELRPKFPYQRFSFNPAVDKIDDVYERVLQMRDETFEFFEQNKDLIPTDSTLRKTLKLFEDEAAIEADNFRIAKSLEFFYQKKESVSSLSAAFSRRDEFIFQSSVYLSNMWPFGDDSAEACAGAQQFRCPYGEDVVFAPESAGLITQGQKEVKTLAYKSDSKKVHGGEGKTYKYKITLGCGDETLAMPGKSTSLVDFSSENSVLIPFTVNPATATAIGVDHRSARLESLLQNAPISEVSISPSLREAVTVTNNLGSRFVSCCAIGKEYVEAIEEKFRPIIRDIKKARASTLPDLDERKSSEVNPIVAASGSSFIREGKLRASTLPDLGTPSKSVAASSKTNNRSVAIISGESLLELTQGKGNMRK